ncbi:MAG TPA: NAD-dependent malic enzyme, partial [Acidimicrobiia bacterium]|nr:NAD-dependent malic enzyme [Acidimicrobiia bacterium]
MKLRPVIDPATGERYLPVEARGRQLLAEPLLNKGTAFTPEEREAFDLGGLLPPQTSTIEQQLERVRSQWDAKPTPVDKHIFLAGL